LFLLQLPSASFFPVTSPISCWRSLFNNTLPRIVNYLLYLNIIFLFNLSPPTI
jgi:hypothetical protein